MKKPAIILAAIVLPVLLGASTCEGDSSAVNADEEQTNTQLSAYQKNQPVPFHDWSQYRQTVLDVEDAQVNSVATTSFFFNAGVREPFKTCPSIGFPVPTTAQLTNPDQVVWRANSGSQVVAQMEPTGVYTGDSSGTYVVCIAPNGDKYISYWEGTIQTEGGPAKWTADGIVLTGKATALSTQQEAK